MTRFTTAAVGIVLLAASPVSAQCLEGRVATEQSEGRCCWPGQTWDDEAAQCTGAPQCPEGFAGEGEQCVQLNLGSPEPAPPPPAQQYSPAQPQQTQAPPPSQYGSPAQNRPTTGREPSARPPPSTGTEPIIGLAVAGGVGFGATYLATGIATMLLASDCCIDGDVLFNLLPVVGPVMYTASDYRTPEFAIMFFLPAALVQAVTLSLMLAGLIVQRPRAPRQQWGAELTGDGLRVYW